MVLQILFIIINNEKVKKMKINKIEKLEKYNNNFNKLLLTTENNKQYIAFQSYNTIMAIVINGNLKKVLEKSPSVSTARQFTRYLYETYKNLPLMTDKELKIFDLKPEIDNIYK